MEIYHKISLAFILTYRTRYTAFAVYENYEERKEMTVNIQFSKKKYIMQKMWIVELKSEYTSNCVSIREYCL